MKLTCVSLDVPKWPEDPRWRPKPEKQHVSVVATMYSAHTSRQETIKRMHFFRVEMWIVDFVRIECQLASFILVSCRIWLFVIRLFADARVSRVRFRCAFTHNKCSQSSAASTADHQLSKGPVTLLQESKLCAPTKFA